MPQKPVRTNTAASPEDDDRVVVVGGHIKPAFKPRSVVWRPEIKILPLTPVKKPPTIHEKVQSSLEAEVKRGGGYMNRKDRRRRRRSILRELQAA